MKDRAVRCMDGDRGRVGDTVRDAEELDLDASDANFLLVGDNVESRLTGQLLLIQSFPNECHCELRAVARGKME